MMKTQRKKQCLSRKIQGRPAAYHYYIHILHRPLDPNVLDNRKHSSYNNLNSEISNLDMMAPTIYSTFTRSLSLMLSSPPNSPIISFHPMFPR